MGPECWIDLFHLSKIFACPQKSHVAHTCHSQGHYCAFICTSHTWQESMARLVANHKLHSLPE